MMRFTVLLFCLFVWGVSMGQKAVYQEVSNARSSGNLFKETPLINFQSNDVLNRSYKLEGLTKGTILTIDQAAIEALTKNRADYISLPLPVSDRSEVNLTLIRHEILA